MEPVYLIAEDSDIPQLKRIIVSDGERLAMEPTLEEALASVLGESATRSVATSGVEDSGQLTAARTALAKAEAALRELDWEAFGRAMRELARTLGTANRR